jgi:hypothetical protein
MKRKSDDLYGTNYEFLKRSFPDLIVDIEDGFLARRHWIVRVTNPIAPASYTPTNPNVRRILKKRLLT